MQPIVDAATTVWSYHPPPQQSLNILGLGLFVVATYACAYYLGTRTKAAARERLMRREREAHVKSLIGDAITEAVEDLIHKQELSRSEAGFWYKRIGHVLTLPDVLSKETKALKEQLKEKHKGKTLPRNVVKIGNVLQRTKK